MTDLTVCTQSLVMNSQTYDQDKNVPINMIEGAMDFLFHLFDINTNILSLSHILDHAWYLLSIEVHDDIHHSQDKLKALDGSFHASHFNKCGVIYQNTLVRLGVTLKK